MKKICIVTSTRADYGLLTGVIKALKAQPGLAIDVIATGTHLSSFHGNTVEAIRLDGINPIEINIEVSGDRPGDILKIMSNALVKFSEYFEVHTPDLIVLLGDRYEIFCVAQAALVHNIPVSHIHGGEVTEGAIDDSFRHSITKMSSLHFASTEEHRQRIIQLGENPEKVFNFGAPGLDNIIQMKLMSKTELEEDLKCQFNEKNILVTFHPLTISEEQTVSETKAFFKALDSLPKNVSIFITMPNADTYSSLIIPIIDEVKAKKPDQIYLFKSLGQLRYLSMMKVVDVVAGNSSSGIIEAPFMNKAVVNVGDRQKGRTSSKHVIHVDGKENSILKGLQLSLSTDFQSKLESFESLYGNGKTSLKIADVLIKQDLKKLLPKKFYDLKRNQDA